MQSVSLRCSLCNLNFPNDSKYRICTECDEATDRIGNVDPMPAEEAQSLLNHANFNKYLATRECS